ncbi:hypothetical protein GCM10029992_41680 [Glycomyces albus]
MKGSLQDCDDGVRRGESFSPSPQKPTGAGNLATNLLPPRSLDIGGRPPCLSPFSPLGGKTNSHSAATHAQASLPASLDRGSFSDGVRSFTVRTSCTEAPDSFQVHLTGQSSEVVLVISGLGAHDLRATWGPQWRTASEGWRDWFEATAFMVFYNGHRPDSGSVRVCNG